MWQVRHRARFLFISTIPVIIILCCATIANLLPDDYVSRSGISFFDEISVSQLSLAVIIPWSIGYLVDIKVSCFLSASTRVVVRVPPETRPPLSALSFACGGPPL